MAKVLVIGPEFYGYTQSVGKALKKNGYEVEILNWIIENELYNFKDKLYVKLFGKRADYIKKKQLLFNNKVIRKYKEFEPDFVLIIRGAVISRETLEAMKKSTIILWMMDSIFFVEKVIQNIDLYNKIFVFEKEDIPKLKNQYNIEAEFLPLALDEDVYFPIKKRKKPIDILFVGALYPNRIAYLNNLIKKFPDKKIKIYGFYFSKIRDIKRFIFRKDKRFYENKTVKPARLNQLYSKSKICLNIHNHQSQYGVNQRFFEISGTRSLQVCDHHGYIEDNFDSDEILIFRSEAELHLIIDKILNQGMDMEKQKEKVYKKVLAEHTFINRMQFIFQKLNRPLNT